MTNKPRRYLRLKIIRSDNTCMKVRLTRNQSVMINRFLYDDGERKWAKFKVMLLK